MPRTYTADEFGAIEAKCLSIQDALSEAQRTIAIGETLNQELHGQNAALRASVDRLEVAMSQAESCVAEYRFAIGDAVIIIGPDFRGGVTGQKTEMGSRLYRVAWWNNGERRHDWLEEPEIRSAP